MCDGITHLNFAGRFYTRNDISYISGAVIRFLASNLQFQHPDFIRIIILSHDSQISHDHRFGWYRS